ncbi:penicillin-binding transpeptidase domain-containing protein [Hoyosella altamirensis]|uniref:Cell division protein FtsI/penicillin-binding protein 2 n=1 Tax=Hoyosella altamirensis TaxID=616997 RepID=A0A839RSK0_9ACTN|nr:penicillin-binding transpeptidase domain-containing protein [Hoyosella altamirensis]MBB3039540.1 cell division protein FtsI/penicillin-binding protein 2 [Hoyosella altamirensis]
MCPQSARPPRRAAVARNRSSAVALLLAAVLGATALIGCEAPPARPDALVTLRAFTDALSEGDAALAAGYTDSPEQARNDIEQVFAALNRDGAEFVVQALTVENSAGRNGADFTLGAVWNLGGSAYGPREWVFSTNGTAVRDGQNWQIAWRPDILVPGLQEGEQVRFRPQPPDPPEIRDRAGQTVMAQQTVKMITLDPTEVTSPGSAADALEPLLRPLDARLTRAKILDTLSSGRGNPVTVTALRDEDYAGIQDQLAAIPGTTVSDQARLLTATRALNSPVFGVLRDSWEARQEESAGWTVELVDVSGSATVLASEPGIPLSDVKTELDLEVQMAAQDAIVDVAEPAVIVALKPSSGAVLAVAQNEAANEAGPIALTGLFPPGAAFTAITALAAMTEGVIMPDETVLCPEEGIYDERRVANPGEVTPEELPFSSAFARSCITTLAQIALGLSNEALHDMALRLGMGLDLETPGLNTITGRVPFSDSGTERVEASIGQGEVRASPFGMALVAASIARGSVPEPVLVAPSNGPARDVSSPSATTETAEDVEEVVPLDLALTNALKHMMREVVTEGSAAELGDLPGLIGAVGTAEGDRSDERHGWFIGIDGDLAFAVFVGDAGTAHAAVDSAGRFLRPLQN